MEAPRRQLRPLPSSGAILLLLALSCPGQTTDEDCLGCHETDKPVVDKAALAGSIHSVLSCVDCHQDAKELPHADDLPKVSCGRCHARAATLYERSVHGQASLRGVKEAPVCTDCHGEHSMRSPSDPASSVSAGAVTRTCSDCHASERIALKFGMPVDRLESYRSSYHGLAYRRKDPTVANCASCHNHHDVLPSKDPRSSVHPSNLPRTCGRCHPGAGAQLAGVSIHGAPAEKHWSVGLARSIYLLLIPFTLGFMLLHNGLDLVRKTRSPRPPATDGGEERLTRHERWQHAVLALSFVLLALSGFALMDPEAAWTRWLAPFSEGTRRALHRWTALAFCLLCVYHVLYLALSGRGRTVLMGMLPRWHDVRALLQHFAWGLGLRKEPPERHGAWHYAEKLEYWALVWGSTVMIVTGGVLVFHGVALRYLPAWTSDLATVVHYYEAVLACLSILVWHGYMVVFDPEVYPMSWAWLTGRVRPRAAGNGETRR